MVMIDAGASLLAAMRALAPELDERAIEAEHGKTIPPDLIDRLRETGAFRMALPASLGGLELDPMTIVEVVEEASKADGSAGWTVCIGNATSFLAWLDPAEAEALIGGNRGVVSTSMFGPHGVATPQDDGTFAIEGRWPCNSGSPHADLFQVGVIVPDGDLAGWRFVFLRRDDVEIHDNWDVVGLRGTGSHDVTVSGLRVGRERLSFPIGERALHDGPLWRMPFWQLVVVLMAGVPLGIARRALDEAETLVLTKHRGASAEPLAKDPHVQREIGLAEAKLQAARAFLFDALDEVWSAVTSGVDSPDASNQRLSLAGRFAMTAAVDAVTTAYQLGGAGVVYAHHPLQRCFRDIHTANQHLFFSDAQYATHADWLLTQR